LNVIREFHIAVQLEEGQVVVKSSVDEPLVDLDGNDTVRTTFPDIGFIQIELAQFNGVL
jgi:hypothetical protein